MYIQLHRHGPLFFMRSMQLKCQVLEPTFNGVIISSSSGNGQSFLRARAVFRRAVWTHVLAGVHSLELLLEYIHSPPAVDPVKLATSHP